MRVVIRKDDQKVFESDGVAAVKIATTPFPTLILAGLIEGSQPLFSVIVAPGWSWEIDEYPKLSKEKE